MNHRYSCVMSDIKVVKVGGSVFKKENLINLVEFIVSNFEPYRTVIVVSALGRSPYPYSTDELLKLFSDFNGYKASFLLDISKSFVISCGENIATGLLSFAINYIKPEFRAIPLNSFQTGIITTESPINSDIIEIKIENILNLIENKFTPVICGFQGVSKTGNITTLKRGGTDITAAFIAKSLKSKEIHIIKDVDGLKSAPPHIVPNSITIEKCHIDELAEASYNGNPIINPEAINILYNTNINIYIRSIFSDKYTISSSNIFSNNLVSTLSNKENISRFLIFLPPYIRKKTYILDSSLKNIYDNQISLDFINLDILNNLASFVVENNHIEKVRQILEDLSISYKIIKNLSKVSVIGYNIRGKPGIMYKINRALLNEKVSILQAQDSHISISLLVPQKYSTLTLNCLHKEFFENNL